MYKNVLLSDEDFEKLKAEFPRDFERRIERLSEYMESSGKHYKSHLATIRSWARRDDRQEKKQATVQRITGMRKERVYEFCVSWFLIAFRYRKTRIQGSILERTV